MIILKSYTESVYTHIQTYRCLENDTDLFANYISLTCSPSDHLIGDCECSQINMCWSPSYPHWARKPVWCKLLVSIDFMYSHSHSHSQYSPVLPGLPGLLPVEDEPWRGEDWPGLCTLLASKYNLNTRTFYGDFLVKLLPMWEKTQPGWN